MPCTRCNGTGVNDQFYDRIDEQGPLRLGAWRRASRCPTCGTLVDERAESMAADASLQSTARIRCRCSRCSSPRPDDHEGGSHALSSLSSCDGEHQQPSH